MNRTVRTRRGHEAQETKFLPARISRVLLGPVPTALDSSNEDPDAAALEEAEAAVRQAIEELRRLARGLYPAALTEEGLGAALEALAIRGGPSMRVVVADDEVLLREGLARLLTEMGFEVVGKAGDPDQLLATIRHTHPQVAIVDIKMPPTHTNEGLVAAEEIRRSDPSVGVLVLSHYLESRYAMLLLQQHPERVGYLLKERISDVAVLTDAIRRIAEGECVIDPTIVARLMTRRRDSGPLTQLTDRDREVLALMAEAIPTRGSATSWSSAPRPWRPTSARSSPSSGSAAHPATTAASSPCLPSCALPDTTRQFEARKDREYLTGRQEST
jgi:DNA-binding NarL/FixJ family response regulator